MCVDLVVDLGRTEPQFGQAEQWIPDYTLEMGGSACIFACQAAKLGLRVAVVGRVGDDAFGRLSLERLGESGVDTRHVQVEPDLKTGLGLALCRATGDRAILTYAGSINAVYPDDLTDDLLRRARHLHYCSYYLQTNLLSAVPAIFRRPRALGLTISLDSNWDPEGRWEGGLAEALALSDLFLPNEQEALAIGPRRQAGRRAGQPGIRRAGGRSEARGVGRAGGRRRDALGRAGRASRSYRRHHRGGRQLRRGLCGGLARREVPGGVRGRWECVRPRQHPGAWRHPGPD